LRLNGQDCNIVSKANIITPDRLCSPLSVNWRVNYTGVNNAGTIVQIRYEWDDGAVDMENTTSTGPGEFQAISNHVYVSTGDKCNYRPKATLVVNGVVCTSSTQEQIVTVWDNDDHNGGHMHINPTVYPICFGNGADVRFRDLTQFNCVPPQENDVPNTYTRWIEWIYGTDNTMTGIPVTINGIIRPFPYSGPIITLPGPVTGSGVFSDVINVANDKLIGQYFQVTLRNWNYCNPYDDPDIPGTPIDPVNGDHPPITTTAIILIVPYPDATITPVDTLCIQGDPVTLHAHDLGGRWSGNGVRGNTFDPALAGIGDHIIRYDITDSNGCSASDQITVTVMPPPVVNINSVPVLFINDPPVILVASPPGGTFSGNGITSNTFNPGTAGIGIHVITYQTATDRFGCTASDTIHIKVLTTPPDATITPVDTLCVKSNPVTLTAHDPGGTWSGDGVVDDKFYPELAGPGNHIITYEITDINGYSDSDQITITVMPSPVVTINSVPVLFINDPPVILIATPPGGAFTGNGITLNSFNPVSAGIGIHIITYQTAIDTYGCSASDTIHIKVLMTPPDATITPVDTLCIQNSPVTLVAHDPGGTWSGDGVLNDKFYPELAGPGNHIISYEITDINGYSDSDQIIITVMPAPVVIINPVPPVFINDPPILLTASPPGGTFSGDGLNSDKFSPLNAGIGTHVITYQTATDRFGCAGTEAISIIVIMPEKPVADFEPDTTGCSPLFVQFRNLSLFAESYLWDFGDKTFSSEENPSHTYTFPGIYIAKLIVTNFAGQATHNRLITVFQKPTAAFNVYPTDVINNTQVVVFTNFSNNGVSWLWDFGDGNNSPEESPWHKYESEGTYKVALKVTSKDGCMDSSMYNSPIVVKYKTGTIKFPNVFKWNGSGPTGGYWEDNELNDNVFRPFHTNVIEYKLQVFNRWGVLLYESTELQKGWDGYFGGGKLSLEGVYVWKVVGRYADGIYFTKVGDVTFLH
jgi:PKD repeat protein